MPEEVGSATACPGTERGRMNRLAILDDWKATHAGGCIRAFVPDERNPLPGGYGIHTSDSSILFGKDHPRS
jgi:hypothetical protein